MRRAGSRAAVCLIAAALAPGAASARAALEAPAPSRERVPRPSCSVELGPERSLETALAELAPRSVVCLRPGSYRGPVEITRPVVLWGPPEAVIESTGSGTTLEVTASNSALYGFSIDGSGGRFDTLDAALRIEAEDVRVEGVGIRRAVFGLLVEKSRRITLVGNEILGTEEGPIGLRGDPIRLWETYDSRIERNHVVAGRDVVIWYSSRNRILHNVVSGGRYGTHLMYSHDNQVIGNRYDANVVGTFVMYSRNVELEGNLFLHSAGAAGVGLGLKESGNVTIRANLFVDDTIGTYIDTSPLERSDRNRFERNAFVLNGTAVIFHGREHGNSFENNVLRDNQEQVRVEGNSDSSGTLWKNNYFDDYVGYDLDADGIGDVAYELRSLSGELIRRRPELELLRGTPALWLVDAMAHVAPLFRPRALAVDRAPRMRPAPGVDPVLGAGR
jgi:nitrous oxidase accessory protein